jgi:HrpA-like RNA helicase
MKHLPVYLHRQEILDGLAENQVIIVESPTGSGKTTQIPLILHEAGYADQLQVGITQPRRIATLSVSDFIRRQVGKDDGFVGYKMGFEDTTNSNTRIKVMTDGILLMELKADPLLRSYSVILVDEAHERSLNIDFILGLLKDVMAQRKSSRSHQQRHHQHQGVQRVL